MFCLWVNQINLPSLYTLLFLTLLSLSLTFLFANTSIRFLLTCCHYKLSSFIGLRVNTLLLLKKFKESVERKWITILYSYLLFCDVCICVCVLVCYSFNLLHLTDEERWMASTLPSSLGRCKVLIFSIFLKNFFVLFCWLFIFYLLFFCEGGGCCWIFGLGVALYVLFASFVGKKKYQYTVMGAIGFTFNYIF